MRPGPVLTDRDAQILGTLLRLRVLTTEQLERLYFPSAQTTLRRLRRLEQAGLLSRTVTPTLTSRIVSLTRRGVEAAIEADGGLAGSRLVHSRLPGPFFLRHVVAVNDLWIGLEMSLRRHPGVELLQFICDRDRTSDGHRKQPRSVLSLEVSDPNGRGPLRHVPDAAFVLRRRGRTALFLAEMDRGTEVIGDSGRGVGKALNFYMGALARGPLDGLTSTMPAASEAQGFRVLFVTTSVRRIAGIRKRWGSPPFQPETVKRFIWFATEAVFQEHDLLHMPWVSLSPSDETSYAILSSGPEK